MAEQKPNPLLGAVIGMVQDRQTADVARLELLATVGREVERANGHLERVIALLEVLEKRTRPS